jgi:hypothetical protein
MLENESDYFSRRADEELAAAAIAINAVAADVHREMAERFRVRAEALKTPQPGSGEPRSGS